MSSAQYTVIISDLHLTDAEPSRPRKEPRHPLWKKFKSKEFFIDNTLVQFLSEIEKKSENQPIELVLNGDIFDFDSVMALPEAPLYQVNWFEKRRGLFPKSDRSVFKIKVILEEHALFFKALSDFIKKGHSVVFVPGNHDVELFFRPVQKEIITFLDLNSMDEKRLRFVEWFYISNQDTLIEHGHQQDPYCMCENPLNPLLVDYNELAVRLPFGNVATRYIMNGMGLFNPHVEKNYIMSLSEYARFFFKYLLRTQPLIMWTWFWGSIGTLFHVTFDKFKVVYKPQRPLEDRINECAQKSNASPEIVRRLQELFATPATQNPWMIAKELWLDRAFLITVMFGSVFVFVYQLKKVFDISLYWVFLPLFLLLPFFFFYARSIQSLVSEYKEPDEWLLNQQAYIAKVNRIVYGHTHIPRHEYYGSVEHLNSGTWSPGFTNVECTEGLQRNNYVWIGPDKNNPQHRKAELCQFIDPNWKVKSS